MNAKIVINIIKFLLHLLPITKQLIIIIMGKFVISLQKNGEHMFNLKASNGQVILTSQGYANKAGCLNGIESVKKNAPLDEHYDRKESKNGKPFFDLKASNGQIIGKSELYESVASREKGIESVKKNAPDAAIEDETV